MNYSPYPASYITPYQAQQTMQAQPVNNTGSNMIWVQGESGAKAFPVGPGSSQALFDSESQLFYIKSVDQSGMPKPLRVFRYTECDENEVKKPDFDTSMFVTWEEFDKAIASLKKPTERRTSNGKSLIPRTDE